jgi:predicted transposase/invertase (TIGR01784 family)
MAVVVMAHLRSRTTKSDAQARKQWKWILTRRLYERGYNREDVIRLVRVIDRILTLPPELKRQFKEELEHYEAEAKMQLINSMEELAREEGIEIGQQLGKQEVARNLLRLGIAVSAIQEATDLSNEQIESLQQQITSA